MLIDIEYEYPANLKNIIDEKYCKMQDEVSGKIIVLDDDPTGGQTLHGLAEYTKWSVPVLDEAFLDKRKMFFILTDSRSMREEDSRQLYREITACVAAAAHRAGVEFQIVCRSDSTLRGHYPAETDAIREEYLERTGVDIDGEIIMPFFDEGGRYTVGDIQYLKAGHTIIPVGESEFAKDRTFGFANSDLKLWIEEKTGGRFPAACVRSISLQMLRSLDFDEITEMLMGLRNMDRLVVNATCYTDLKVFCISYLEAISRGKRFIGRTAASWPRVLGGVKGSAFPKRDEILGKDSAEFDKGFGGLVIVGSHVARTTEQLDWMRLSFESGKKPGFIEFDQHLATQPEKLQQETARVATAASDLIRRGETAVVFTKRKRVDLGGGSGEKELLLTNRIAGAVTDVVRNISVRPAFIIAKGGSTSSSIAVKALNVIKAEIIGQAYPGIPIWRLGMESRYPGMPYIIFPGNVGKPETLEYVVDMLR